ncbi:co-chaperone YbbN [Nocardioides mangrovicus]|uniref:Co-chaperone YbbN n=1 Tax=Nocardioides mangrovicus TaxID=2478913 RepID=A0A3L8P8K8_9ACTN|nr:tetratricopeptide repeat protein [Nocardioides mangrovicus]RLV51069.1 co-chaperone YbbN [Nocardioides mangrovicus]
MSTPQRPRNQQAAFTRPGAVDLSALKQPAAPGPGAGADAAGGGAPGGGVVGAYTVQVDEQNFQQLLEQSMTAPVLLSFYSPTRAPASVGLADDLQSLADEFEGKFLLGRVDIDAVPQIAQAAAQAMQAQALPLVALVAQGRPMPLFEDAPPLEELRTGLTQVFQQLATQGFTGRHQPRSAAPAGESDSDEPPLDPRYAPAQNALEANDLDGAVAEYQKLVDANPADAEAAGGLAMAKVLQRTQGVNLQTARESAASAPDDVDAQTLVADLDMLGGHVEDAFNRLIEVIRRTADADRDRARNHLIGLFAAVGNDDPRVLAARRGLASALF